MSEHPRDRIARHFGLGAYGNGLAQELLDEYRNLLADWLDDEGYPGASKDLRTYPDRLLT